MHMGKETGAGNGGRGTAAELPEHKRKRKYEE